MKREFKRKFLKQKIVLISTVCIFASVPNIALAQESIAYSSESGEGSDETEGPIDDCSDERQKIAKDMLVNAMDSQENYKEEYDYTENGKVTFSDLAILLSYDGFCGGKIDYAGKEVNSEEAALNVSRKDDKVIVEVEFIDPSPAKSKGTGFDYAIMYDNNKLKFEKLEWDNDFLETYSISEENHMSSRVLLYEDMKEYVAMTGVYYNYNLKYGIGKKLAKLTFSIINDTENVTSDIDIVFNATAYKQDVNQMKSNIFRYVVGSFYSENDEPLNLMDAEKMLRYVLGIDHWYSESLDEMKYDDLTGDNRLTFQDVIVALKQALGIEPPIYLKWDGTTFDNKVNSI